MLAIYVLGQAGPSRRADVSGHLNQRTVHVLYSSSADSAVKNLISKLNKVKLGATAKVALEFSEDHRYVVVKYVKAFEFKKNKANSKYFFCELNCLVASFVCSKFIRNACSRYRFVESVSVSCD